MAPCQVRLYILFTVALCALQAIGLQVALALQIEFGWSTVVLANFCAAQAVLWSFIRQSGRVMTQTEKLLFAGYAALLTTGLALTVLWLGDVVQRPAEGVIASLLGFLLAQNLAELAIGFGVSVAAIIMGLSFGARTCLRIKARFAPERHSAGAAKRV